MDRHVTRRILHGLGANAYGQLVAIVIQLAGVPILLHAWGTQLYGEWLILAAIPTYLSMTDFGVLPARPSPPPSAASRRMLRCLISCTCVRASTSVGFANFGTQDKE